MTRKQEMFASEYLIDMNATQAALRAGYSPISADAIGCELLRQPEIADTIARHQAQRLARVGMSQDDVLHEMSLLSHSQRTRSRFMMSSPSVVTSVPKR